MNAARSKRVVWVVNGRSHNRAERHVCNVCINWHVGGCATRFSKSLTGGRFYSHPYSLVYNFLHAHQIVHAIPQIMRMHICLFVSVTVKLAFIFCSQIVENVSKCTPMPVADDRLSID